MVRQEGQSDALASGSGGEREREKTEGMESVFEETLVMLSCKYVSGVAKER